MKELNRNGRLTILQCHHFKSDGSRCRANVLHSSNYCFFHDPHSAIERKAARIRGGQERSRKAAFLPANTPDNPLTKASDVVGLLAETINQVRRGEVDPRISNAVGYLAGILLKAKQEDDLERRLMRLESIVSGQDVKSKAEMDALPSPAAFEFVEITSGTQM